MDASNKTNARVAAMQRYFSSAPPDECCGVVGDFAETAALLYPDPDGMVDDDHSFTA